jgi:hypothetical protein
MPLRNASVNRSRMTLQARDALTNMIMSVSVPDEVNQQRVQQVQCDLMFRSPHLRELDFTRIRAQDLEFLFAAYDRCFFGGLCQAALDGRRLTFRLSTRMTRAGGKTTRFSTSNGEVRYEISIAIATLFDGFGETDRRVTVCGLDCENRLEALQRIFEHELVHLIEQLCWGTSDCAARRFQDIAARIFRHRAHTHQLITRWERASNLGIRIGSRVTFTYQGRQMSGRVNRITKRATVLVEDSHGRPYSDSVHYKAYYVPLACLALEQPMVAEA